MKSAHIGSHHATPVWPALKACFGASLLLYASAVAAQEPGHTPSQTAPAISRMVLKSNKFPDGGIIPDRYTQAVAMPISPPLCWEAAPTGTMSFALIASDLDSAPKRSSSGVLHWLVFNIPAHTACLPEGVPAVQTLLDGTVQGRNFGGLIGYRGPGAPAGGPYHHYSFELYALDTVLDLGPTAGRVELLAAAEGHVLAKAALIGKFHK